MAVRGGQVAAASGDTIAAGVIGSFRVNVVPPSASALAPDITAAGSGDQAVAVTFKDDHAVDVATLDPGGLRVPAPAGSTRRSR